MLAIKLMHMKFHGDEFQQVLVWNDDADGHAGIFDHLFRHCGHPIRSASLPSVPGKGRSY